MGNLLREIKRRSAAFIMPSIIICIAAYFTYHLVNGDRGILSWQSLSKNLQEKEAKLASLKESYESLERRVVSLRSHICPDLLEERAKDAGFLHPNDVIIFKKDLEDH
jgi:cell division protein FtsB